GHIVVRTWSADAWVFCAVADDGVGMDDEIRRRALEAFFTTKGPQATGLGLSVAHSVVQRHGGELSLRPNDGTGTVVTLRLPQAVPAEVPLEPEPTPEGEPLHILVIDDEQAVREALTDSFAVDGHTVVAVASGAEGLARLADGGRFDVV